MPGLNCSFRIEEIDSLIDTFESDDAESDDSLNFDLSLGDSEYSANSFDYCDSSEDSESSEDDETSDEGSDDKSEQSSSKKSNDRSFHNNVDFVAQELCKMDTEQSELAQNLIAAILHEGVMGRLTPNTMLKDLSKEENDIPNASNEP